MSGTEPGYHLKRFKSQLCHQDDLGRLQHYSIFEERAGKDLQGLGNLQGAWGQKQTQSGQSLLGSQTLERHFGQKLFPQ